MRGVAVEVVVVGRGVGALAGVGGGVGVESVVGGVGEEMRGLARGRDALEVAHDVVAEGDEGAVGSVAGGDSGAAHPPCVLGARKL